MLVIVDFGMGNLRSIQHKLEKAGVAATITSKISEIGKATKIILPGVGHFAQGMQNLNQYNLVKILERKILTDKIPILGICLGMQLFSLKSEEGNAQGLGWINAKTKKFSFPSESKWRIPHVGWNSIILQRNSPLFNNIVVASSRYYFTHSYHMECLDPDDIIATTDYGGEFVSAIQKNNIYGTQFHPEKSHRNGFNIIKNFTEI